MGTPRRVCFPGHRPNREGGECGARTSIDLNAPDEVVRMNLTTHGEAV
jgi:hypothetical protein